MKSNPSRSRRVARSFAALLALAAVTAACGEDTSSGSSATTAASTGDASEPGATEPAEGTTPAATEPNDGTAPASQPDTAFTAHFVNPLPNYPAWKEIGDCMRAQAEVRGLEYSESGPTGTALDASQMIEQVQQAIANDRSAIITFPTGDGFSEVLKQAQEAGIVTGTLYGPGTTGFGADVNAGPDFNDIGTKLVEAVAALPGEHVLGLVAESDTGLGKAWMDGVRAAAEKAPNVTIAGEVFTGDDAAKALPQVTALLTAHPEVTEIVTHMGTITPGAVAAIKALDRVGKTFLLAGGHDNGGSEAVEEGTANLILMQNVCMLATTFMDGVADVLEGKPAPTITPAIAVIGPDELQQYLDDGWV